jgi:hypothetical protein
MCPLFAFTWTVSLEQTRQPKMDMRFGTWNLKSFEMDLKEVWFADTLDSPGSGRELL